MRKTIVVEERAWPKPDSSGYFRLLPVLWVLLICLVTPSFCFARQPLTSREESLILHVLESLKQADNYQSKIPKEVYSLEGMSGWKVRHFLNNVCSLPKTVYLEIGTWKGSTLIPALYKNEASVIDAVAIDNWSEFGGPREEFYQNIKTFLPNAPLRAFDSDSFSFPVEEVFDKKVNVYFYDGHHSAYNQERAFTYYDSILDDVFIAIIDDWNWSHVQDGTFSAFRKLNYVVLYEKELLTNANGDGYGWWNGIYVAVIRKNSGNSVDIQDHVFGKDYPMSKTGKYVRPEGISDATFGSPVNIEKIQQKWNCAIPSWMTLRIRQELAPFLESPFSQEAISKTWERVKSVNHMTRYRIIDGSIYRQGEDPYGFMDSYLRTVAFFCTFPGIPNLPNLEFIVCQADAVPIAPGDFDPVNYWISEDIHDQAPIFAYARAEDAKFVITIPDRFTIPDQPWLGWPTLAPEILRENGRHPWGQKKKMGCWRGATTDFNRHGIPGLSQQEVIDRYSQCPRYLLCELSLNMPTLMDAGFTAIHTPAPFLIEFVRPLMKPAISPGDHLDCAYLPVLDGYTSTYPGYLWRLLSNSVALKQETKDSQWFYDVLKPYVHYIPIKENLEDLVEKIAWAKEHDEECREIAENSTNFVLQNLMIEDHYVYQMLVFLEYAKCQKFQTQDLLQETKESPDWVQIR